ncbi:MAG: hypothetical protein IJ689_03355, partial [Alphaproteobacteria bacterium]|nr:hypothetical protein [Alphaproteobacteria bacterium]
PHQVRRDIGGKLNSPIVVLNLFQDLKKRFRNKFGKTSRVLSLPMSIAGLDPAIKVYNIANCFNLDAASSAA